MASTDAEESAAVALIQVLKVIYRFEAHGINFCQTTSNDLCKEQLEKELFAVKNQKERQSEE